MLHVGDNITLRTKYHLPGEFSWAHLRSSSKPGDGPCFLSSSDRQDRIWPVPGKGWFGEQLKPSLQEAGGPESRALLQNVTYMQTRKDTRHDKSDQGPGLGGSGRD